MSRPAGWIQHAVRETPDPIVVVGPHRAVVMASEAACALFRYEPGELESRPVETLFDESHRHVLLGSLRELTTQPIVRRRELHGRRRDGESVFLAATLSAIEWEDDPAAVVLLEESAGQRRHDVTQHQMAALVDSAEDAIVSKTLDGIVRSWNPGATRLLGYRAHEIIGQPITLLIPAEREGEEDMIIERIRSGQHVAHFETQRRRRDGALIDVSLTISPIRDSEGVIIGASKIMRDITERKRANEALERLNEALRHQVEARNSQLRERDVMLQEIHHRVKNNLQVISSLINLQARTIHEPGTKASLQQCQQRVATMAQIHEMLYRSADYGQVPFAEYVRELVSRILTASVGISSRLALHFELEPLSLPLDQAMPCSLILHELVTNAIKHAFPAEARGTLRISLTRTADRTACLTVGDDGVGLAGPLPSKPDGGLGFHLVKTLARQLGADVRVDGTSGTAVSVLFPLEPPHDD